MTTPLPKTKRLGLLTLAAVVGAMAFSFVAPAFAQTNLVTVCFRTRTIQIPSYLVPTYQLQGATPGACVASGQ